MPAERIENYLGAYSDLEIRSVKGNFARDPIPDRANVVEAAAAIVLPDVSLSEGHEKRDDQRALEDAIAIKDMANDVIVYVHVMHQGRLSNLKRTNIESPISRW